MEEKRVLQQNPLLEARQEALQRAESTALRPLGKWQGMDVFTWYKPSVYELSAVISAFPFPVCWFGTQDSIQELATVDPSCFKSITWVAQYDCSQMSVPADAAAPVPLITATENLEDTLMFLGELKQPKRVLLFTCHGNEWKTNLKLFEEFIQK